MNFNFNATLVRSTIVSVNTISKDYLIARKLKPAKITLRAVEAALSRSIYEHETRNGDPKIPELRDEFSLCVSIAIVIPRLLHAYTPQAERSTKKKLEKKKQRKKKRRLQHWRKTRN